MNHPSRYERFAITFEGKTAAIAELLGVFFIGSLLASVFYRLAGITGHPLMALTGENPDMFAVSAEMFRILLLQNAGWLILIVLVAFSFSRTFIRQAGLTTNGYPLLWLVGMGIVGWVIGDLPGKIIWLVDAEFNIGTSVPWREALINTDRTAGWWTLMAISSFGLVPVVEEIFWRGYVQARLQNSFSPAIAVMATALMFTLSHAQYHVFDAYHIATIVSLFFSALVLGWVFYRSGSLVPAIVMHMLLNFPVDGMAMYLVIGLMTAAVAWQWRVIHSSALHFIDVLRASGIKLYDVIVIVSLAVSMLCLSQFPGKVFYIGYVAIAVLVCMAAYFRFSAKFKD